MKQFAYFLLLAFTFLFAAPVSIAAVTVSFSNTPVSIDQSQDFQFDTLLSCSGCTSDSYLRAVFFPSGTSYFGYTQNNGGSWINAPASSCTQYFKIASSDLSEGSWSGKLRVKPDTQNTFYSGPGEYLFKVGRYTPSCGSPTWSSETTITITGPTPTPTPAPTSTSMPTPTNTQAPQATSTSIPLAITVTKKVTPTKIPTPTSSPTSEPQTLGEATRSSSAVDIIDLSSLTESTPTSTGAPRVLIMSLLFIGLGLALLALLFVWKKRKTWPTPKETV